VSSATWQAGIDEAGYGPLLGPLVIACVAVHGLEDLNERLRAAGVTVDDSKRIHAGGRLDRLESVALPALGWLAGFTPATAAEAFALLGEAPAARICPWMAGAAELALPAAGGLAEPWPLPPPGPRALAGAIIHPREMNDAAAAGRNRAAIEAEHIARLLRGLPAGPGRVVCDRLGGRRFYAPLLTEVWPGAAITIDDESRDSCYRLTPPELAIAFLVGAESRAVTVAIASCIAKYLRELHLLLFNAYWSQRLPWLRPTAGYPQDAKRWLYQLGDGVVAAYGPDLVRGHRAGEDQHAG
jgi:ribonuclease HII